MRIRSSCFDLLGGGAALAIVPLLAGCASGARLDIAPQGGADEAPEEVNIADLVDPGTHLERCAYPEAGDTGIGVGDTVRGTLEWDGYPEGAVEPGQITIEDYYDCSGLRGINALYIVESAMWCGVCQTEAQDVAERLAGENGWAAKGIEVLTLVAEEYDGQPATARTARNWRDRFDLDITASTVVADPGYAFLDRGDPQAGFPVVAIVDPRTMEILYHAYGTTLDHSEHRMLEDLAERNAR